MDNTKNDTQYINHIVEDLSFIIKHTKDIDSEELGKNEILLDSMLFRLIQISENVRKLTDEYKEQRSDVPWNAIYGLRNRIVHDYGNVDLGIVYSTLKIKRRYSTAVGYNIAEWVIFLLELLRVPQCRLKLRKVV